VFGRTDRIARCSYAARLATDVKLTLKTVARRCGVIRDSAHVTTGHLLAKRDQRLA
jgi:hypothetical protein